MSLFASVPFDPSALPGDDPISPNAAPSQAAVFPDVRLFDPSAQPGDNPVAITSAPVSGVAIGPVAVGYTPDANAAVTVTPGTLDSTDNFTPSGPALGPYAASVSMQDGVYSLTVTVTDVLADGALSLQPGDWAGGAFTAIGPAIVGTLTSADGSAALDWEASATGVYVSFTATAAVLAATATEWVHLGVQVTDALSGDAILLAGNPNIRGVAMAIIRNDPGAADWQPAQIITRAAGDETDGEYAAIKAGPGGALLLLPGLWDVYAQVTTVGEVIQIKAPNALTVI